MKFLVLAALFALCTASSLYRGKHITVNDDGTIVITNDFGKRIVITKPTPQNGRKNIDINISGPNIPSKTIQINDQYVPHAAEDVNLFQDSKLGQYPYGQDINEEMRDKRASTKTASQSDVLLKILKEYQGVVDDASYQKLLQRVDKAVKKGELNNSIYQILENLDTNQISIDDALAIGKGQDLSYQQGIQGEVGQYPGYLGYLYGRQGQGLGSGYGVVRPGYGYGIRSGYGVNPSSSYLGQVQQQGYPVQQKGYPIQQQGYPVQQQGYPVQQQGYPVQQQSYPVQQQGYPIQQQGYPVQQQGLLNPFLGYSQIGLNRNLYDLGVQQQQYLNNLGYSGYVNPLLQQQFYGVRQPLVEGTTQLQLGLERGLGNQIVYGNLPLSTSSRGILGGEQQLLREYLLARNQVPQGVQGLQGQIQGEVQGQNLGNILTGRQLPTQPLYRGVKEGYGTDQQPLTVLQREPYVGLVDVPQIVY